MISILLFALLSASQSPPPSDNAPSLTQADVRIHRSGSRETDVLLAQSYVAAARRAHQNPRDMAAQLKAARYAFAVYHVAAPFRRPDLALSIFHFGETALALDPDSAEADLWFGVGLGEVSLARHFFVLPKVREKYEAALRSSTAKDADCLSGLARLHLARMVAAAPAFFGWARVARVESLMHDSQQRFPHNPLPAVYLAEFRGGRHDPAAQGQAVRPSTPFEHLMLLATSQETKLADFRMFALLDPPL